VYRGTNARASLRLKTASVSAAAESETAPRIDVMAQWNTSLLRRQANLRLKVLASEITEAQAQQAMQQSPQFIIIQLYLISNDRFLFRDAAALEKGAQSDAYLLFPRSKVSLRPEKVEVISSDSFEKPTVVRLSFLRARDGQPAVPAGEKNAKVGWKNMPGGFRDLEVQFDLEKLGSNPATDF